MRTFRVFCIAVATLLATIVLAALVVVWNPSTQPPAPDTAGFALGVLLIVMSAAFENPTEAIAVLVVLLALSFATARFIDRKRPLSRRPDPAGDIRD